MLLSPGGRVLPCRRGGSLRQNCVRELPIGFLLSLILRRRWLSLAGLAVCFAAVPVGFLTSSNVITAGLIGIGGLLLLAQVVVSLRRNIRALREGQPPRF